MTPDKLITWFMVCLSVCLFMGWHRGQAVTLGLLWLAGMESMWWDFKGCLRKQDEQECIVRKPWDGE